MKKVLFVLFSIGVLFLVGCAGIRPQVNAGYYIDVMPESKASINIGTNNTQSNAIHAPIGKTTATTEGETADADKQAEMAKSSGLFVNNNVGDRSADVDTTAALELLRNVTGTSAGQAQTTSKGDSSPTTSGDQSQTPTSTDTTTVPIAVGQTAPKAEAEPPKEQ